MKKLVVSLLFVLYGSFILTACKKTEYYYSEIYASSILNEDTSVEKTVEVSEKQKEICQEVFKKLIEYYGIDKPMPNLSYTSKDEYEGSIMVRAYYDHNNKTVYLRKKFSDSQADMATVCHEFVHYLSDDGQGAYYLIGEYKVGCKFLEGVTNYLSTKVYPFEKDASVYEFETHIASLFANAIGEENLANYYFLNSFEELKKNFNDLMSDIYPDEKYQSENFTPFDALLGNMETYYYMLGDLSMYPQYIHNIIKICDSCEEELYIYNIKKDKEEEAEKIIKAYIKSENMGLAKRTHFKQIIGG